MSQVLRLLIIVHLAIICGLVNLYSIVMPSLYKTKAKARPDNTTTNHISRHLRWKNERENNCADQRWRKTNLKEVH